MLKSLRTLSIMYLMGCGTGSYGVYEGLYQPFLHIAADRGYCSQRDPMGTAYWYRCKDTYFAAQLQLEDAHEDKIANLIEETSKPKKNSTRK